jgi:predicted nucleic acid-binding protein
MGILFNAKFQGAIPSVKPLIKTLVEENYRLSDKVLELVLARAGK